MCRLDSLQALREDGIETLECDVTLADSVQKCVTAVLEKSGVIHVLINNAGASFTYPTEALLFLH